MGKHANQLAYREFERLDRASQESIEADAELTEYQRAAEWDNDLFTRKDDAEHMARIAAEAKYFIRNGS